MARIRSIKPELPRDAKLAKVSRATRYTFLLLLTQADDEGYFIATPRTLVGAIYPHDPDVTETVLTSELDSLLALGVIRCFDTPDGIVGQLANFARHQRIDHASKSHLARQSRTPRETFASRVLSLDLGSKDSRTMTAPAAPETENAKPGKAKRKPPAEQPDPVFEDAWLAYPLRSGGNPKAAARRQWDARVAAGEDRQVMLAGTQGYARWARSEDKVNTVFVMRAERFYGRDRCYADFVPPAPRPSLVKPAPTQEPEPTPAEREQAKAAAAASMAEFRRLVEESKKAAGAVPVVCSSCEWEGDAPLTGSCPRCRGFLNRQPESRTEAA